MNGDARPRATNQRSRWPCLIKDFYHLLRGLNQPEAPLSLSPSHGTWFPQSCRDGGSERVVIWKKQIDPNCRFLASLQRVRKGFRRFYLDSLGSSDRPVSVGSYRVPGRVCSNCDCHVSLSLLLLFSSSSSLFTLLKTPSSV